MIWLLLLIAGTFACGMVVGYRAARSTLVIQLKRAAFTGTSLTVEGSRYRVDLPRRNLA